MYLSYNHHSTKGEPTNHIMSCLVLCDYDYIISSVPIEHKHVGPIVPQTECLRLPNELYNVCKCSDYVSQMKFQGFTQVVPKFN